MDAHIVTHPLSRWKADNSRKERRAQVCHTHSRVRQVLEVRKEGRVVRQERAASSEVCYCTLSRLSALFSEESIEEGSCKQAEIEIVSVIIPLLWAKLGIRT